MATQRWKLTIEYDGTPFCGWQRQEDGIPSVQKTIEDAFLAFCQQAITIHVAGRTDAGVHARGQVAHADLDYGGRPLSGYELAKALNALSHPAPVAILSAEPVSDDFHARFNATNKLYTYRILNRPGPAAIDAGHVWQIRKPLDAAAMHDAGQILLGHHDFTTFRDSACQAKSPMKTLDRLDVEQFNYPHGPELHIHAEGRSFLHHQVRNMTGALVMVGEGKWTKQDLADALAARDRTKGGPNAPPDGLYLMRVDY